MTELFGEVAHKMPLPLVEPVEKMINRDIRYRPTAQLFMMASLHKTVTTDKAMKFSRYFHNLKVFLTPI